MARTAVATKHIEQLQIAKDLALPLDVVTQKLAWIGTTGSGKTYGASKLAELLWDAHAQFLVLDPVGVWYGLRLARDGKKPSDIRVPIFGGLHGDVPIEATGGAVMADLVVDRTLSCIIDVSQFESDAQKARFASDFADRFFFRKKAAPSAVHLFIEECQEFVPEHQQRGEERMLHAFTRLQKIGRNFGVGTSYITQRPQEVAKKALNLAGTLFVFRTTGSHERAAIERWIKDKAIEGQDISSELPKLKTGAPHVWSPEWLAISDVVHIQEKRTFNASATPEVGAAAATRELAAIDLEKIRADMAATIEKAKQDDPRELRRQIAELKAENSKLSKSSIGPDSKQVEKPVLTDADRELLKKVRENIQVITLSISERTSTLAQKFIDAHLQVVEQVIGEFEQRLDSKGLAKILAKLEGVAQVAAPGPGGMAPSRVTSTTMDRRPATRVAPTRPSDQAVAVNGDALPIGERKILTVCAQYPDGATREQLTVLTGYKKSSRNAYLQRLAGKGYIEDRGDTILVTAAGVQALGPAFQPLPTGKALRQYWLERLPAGERVLLEECLEAHPRAIDRERLTEATGYKKSSRNAYIQRLAVKRLVDASGSAVKASDILFD